MYNFLYEGKAAEEAKKKGYVSAGWGRWKKGKSGPVVAKTVGDKLVPIKAQNAGAAKPSGKKPAGKAASSPTSKSTSDDEFGMGKHLQKAVPKPEVDVKSPKYGDALVKLANHKAFNQKFEDVGAKVDDIADSYGGSYIKIRAPNKKLFGLQPQANAEGKITGWSMGEWSGNRGDGWRWWNVKSLDAAVAKIGKGHKGSETADKITAAIQSGKGTLTAKQAVTYAKAAKRTLMKAKHADDVGVGKDKNGNAQIWLSQPGSHYGDEGMGGSLVTTMTVAPNGKTVVKVSLTHADRKSNNGVKYTEKYDNPARAFQALLNNDI